MALNSSFSGGTALRLRTALVFLLSVLFLASVTGCKSKKADEAVQRYPIEGVVMGVDPKEQTITLKHHEVVGYMKAMTMPFNVKDKWVYRVVHVGDTVQATLVVGADDAWLENVSVTQSAQAADQSNTSPVHRPQQGDAVPDFAFVNQQGKPIHLAQFRGQPLLLTFVYTRCPLPDFCIRMSNNFVQVAEELKNNNPRAFARLQMLSISIDPDYDSPKVLTEYGKRYAATVDPQLKHWSFATGKPEEIRKAAEFFALSYQPQNGQITHTLSTALLDASGKLAEFYTGNGWSPSEVADKLAALQK
jgi:protein SCO1/2